MLMISLKNAGKQLNTFQKPLTRNPNTAWNLDTFSNPIKNKDNGYSIINTDGKEIICATQKYSNHLSTSDFIIVNQHLSGYIGLDTEYNWIKLIGISGVLKQIKIAYWGDYSSGFPWYIAKTIQLFSDNNPHYIQGTRSGEEGYTLYSFSPKLNLAINNTLTIKFFDTTFSDSTSAYIIYRVFFTFES